MRTKCRLSFKGYLHILGHTQTFHQSYSWTSLNPGPVGGHPVSGGAAAGAAGPGQHLPHHPAQPPAAAPPAAQHVPQHAHVPPIQQLG